MSQPQPEQSAASAWAVQLYDSTAHLFDIQCASLNDAQWAARNLLGRTCDDDVIAHTKVHEDSGRGDYELRLHGRAHLLTVWCVEHGDAAWTGANLLGHSHGDDVISRVEIYADGELIQTGTADRP
jgi:hypothetical protein